MSDTVVALAVIVMHATVIMCQGMAFSVAMNSKRSSALVALLIASNFVEIKGVCCSWQGAELVTSMSCQLDRASICCGVVSVSVISAPQEKLVVPL